MVLPTASDSSSADDGNASERSSFYEAGKGNVLQHFAGLTTPDQRKTTTTRAPRVNARSVPIVVDNQHETDMRRSSGGNAQETEKEDEALPMSGNNADISRQGCARPTKARSASVSAMSRGSLTRNDLQTARDTRVRHMVDDSDDSPPPSTSHIFPMEFSPPRHRAVSRSRQPAHDESMKKSSSSASSRSHGASSVEIGTSRTLNGSALDVSFSSGSFSLQSSMEFLSRDLEEEDRANKTTSDQERAFLFKKRYMDVYGVAVGLAQHIMELEQSGEEQARVNATKDRQLKRLADQVDAMSSQLTERKSLSYGQKEDDGDSNERVEALQQQHAEDQQLIETLTAKLRETELLLEAVSVDHVQLQESMQQTEQQLEAVHTQWLKEKSDLVDVVEDTKMKMSSELEKLCEEKTELEAKLRHHVDHSSEFETRCEQLQRLVEEEKRRRADVEQKMRSMQDQVKANIQMETVLQRTTLQLREAQEGLCVLSSEKDKLQRELARGQQQWDTLRRRLDTQMLDLQTRLFQSEAVRRRLHNKVMELKGNIRVFCRVRPVLTNERQVEDVEEVLSFPDSTGERRQIELAASPRSHLGYGQGRDSSIKKYAFDFDLVFPGACSQSDVFLEVSALVQSALDGFNVCIFAYGQTGSGKTYTMQGSTPDRDQTDQMGIIGRAIAHIFATVHDMRSSGWKFDVRVEAVEIYNETLRDLLAPAEATDKVELRMDADGKPVVLNACSRGIDDERAAWRVLQEASRRRSTKTTNMNDRSSRSHCVISFRLHGANSLTSDRRSSVVHFVDLAGSERLSKSGSANDKDLLKETQSINKSLSALGNVICALANKSAHVPFRDSKLTHILSPSLGGDSKTLMICTLSPLAAHRDETLNSLRFAKTVNSCEIAFPSFSSSRSHS